MRVGVVLRGKYGKRAVKEISEFFEVYTYELPQNLPEIIDEPEELHFPEELFKCDVIVSYALHPDVNYEIIRRAAGKVKYVLLPGGAKSGSKKQLEELGKKYGVNVLVENICCATPKIDDPDVKEFFEKFGMPEFEIEVEDGIIKSVKVKRSSICGSSKFVAEKLVGMRVDEAPTKAGYLTQIYPCFASRGIDGKIHRAAHIHKRQVEKALKD